MQTLTPNRRITIEFDPTSSVQVEPFFAKHRDRFEIKNPTLDGVEQLASGCFILTPVGTHLFNLHETTAGQATIAPITNFNHPGAIQTIPVQRLFTETDADPSGAVSTSGDHFYVKRVPALTSWNIGLIETRPIPPLPTTPNYPLDVVMQHNVAPDVADCGYVVRWIHPGHGQELIDYPLSFMFGGPIHERGFGQFELTFGGDGRAYLAEWIDGAWSRVDEWRYAASELVPGSPHVVRIIPHAARFLEIRSNITERTQPGFLFDNRRLTAFSGQSVALDAHVYEVRNRGDLPGGPGGLGLPVTGPGSPEFRVRRDLVLRWQLAKVTYPASGTLRDQAFTIPQVDTSSHVLAIRKFYMVEYNALSGAPQGSVDATAYNALTGAALTPASENWTLGATTHLLNGFTLPGRPNAIQVEMTLTSTNANYSPWFFGYEAHKIGENATSTAAPIIINDAHTRQSPCVQLSVTGPDADASHETAALRVQDLTNRIPRLGTRGEGRLKITTTFEPTQAKSTVLFDGYWIKSEGRLRGKPGRTYPSPSWTEYSITAMGMWRKLAERAYLANQVASFGKDLDPTTPPDKGKDQPWKVTDVIRALLVYVGVPESQILVPDLPIRLWGNNVDGKDTIQIQPGTNVAEFIARLGADYLNYFLRWDANCGDVGAWRLLPMPRGTEAAVWHFTATPALPGRVASHSGAYGSNTSFIVRDSLREWVLPPDGNWLRITGEVDGKLYACEANNPKAYNKPGQSTADPDHPDYTDGQWRPIFMRHDNTLLTREAVQFVTRRVFDLVCRAQRYARFTCPLPLIDASVAEPTVYTSRTHRPLAFGDVVTWRNGKKAMVRAVNLAIAKEHSMLAQVELVLFNDPLPT